MLTSLIIQTTSGTYLDDWSLFARSCIVRSGEHGFESLEAELQLPFYDAFNYYVNYGPLKVICIFGPSRIFEGRLNDPTQFVRGANGGLKIVALGYWIALSDTQIVALWSTTQLQDWKLITSNLIASCIPERFEMINQTDQLSIAPKKNENQSNTVFGAYYYIVPDGGSRDINGVALDFSIVAADANWRLEINSYAAGFTSGANLVTISSAAGTVTGCVNTTLTARSIIAIFFYSNTSRAPFTGETGDVRCRITNVRLVTATTNRLATSLTANRTAGTNVTATVGSTSGMYVGQNLQVDPNSTTGETVTVISIGSATQFNATFAKSYLSGVAIRSMIVYPNEIINDCVAIVAALNSTQISAATGMIQNQGVDQLDAIFEDMTPADVINTLVKSAGDTQTTPRVWTALVYDNQQLIVRPRGTGRAWLIDADSLDIQRALSQLANSITAVYSEPAGRKRRTTATDSSSVARFGLTRRKTVHANTADVIQAGRVRDTTLYYARDPIPRVNFPINAIYDGAGIWHDPRELRADDTVTIRNFPPIVATLYDKIRTLVVTRVSYDVIAGRLKDVELELPMPNLDAQLARITKRV